MTPSLRWMTCMISGFYCSISWTCVHPIRFVTLSKMIPPPPEIPFSFVRKEGVLFVVSTFQHAQLWCDRPLSLSRPRRDGAPRCAPSQHRIRVLWKRCHSTWLFDSYHDMSFQLNCRGSDLILKSLRGCHKRKLSAAAWGFPLDWRVINSGCWVFRALSILCHQILIE